jgi:formylglycine-generating enzyme required for sulfatase activity
MEMKYMLISICLMICITACGSLPEELDTEELQQNKTEGTEEQVSQATLIPKDEETITPTLELPSFFNDLSSVTDGQGVPGAIDYQPNISGPHRLVILDSNGSPHEWNRQVPFEWRPTALEDTKLVAVLGQKEETAIESRSYSGDIGITRYRYSMPIEVREASTGDLLWRSIIFGSEPKELEWTIIFDEDNPPSRYEGEHVSYSDFEEWMQCKVDPQTCFVANISTQIRAKDEMAMVFVPGGEFIMGSDEGSENEKPVHTVGVDAFWIDQTEVTDSMYASCVEAGACSEPEEPNPLQVDAARYDAYPVIHVSWFQANDYCNWVGGRLPTEAEWEKAARGTDSRMYPWGDDEPTCQLANYESCFNGVSTVGSYSAGASPFGALDMAGNVWEWVGDWYAEDYYIISPSLNPLGPEIGQMKILKGGSWWWSLDITPMSSRFPAFPDEGSDEYGFRCAMSE